MTYNIAPKVMVLSALQGQLERGLDDWELSHIHDNMYDLEKKGKYSETCFTWNYKRCGD